MKKSTTPQKKKPVVKKKLTKKEKLASELFIIGTHLHEVWLDIMEIAKEFLDS